jgi:hypothetical protein
MHGASGAQTSHLAREGRPQSEIRAVGPPTRTPTPPGVLRRADDSVDPVYAARNEYKIVLAIMPLPANPMDT